MRSVGRKVGEIARRTGVKIASAGVAGVVALTGCGTGEPLVEPIPLNHPVPPREGETNPAPTPNTTPAPTTTEAAPPAFTDLNICMAAFVDRLNSRVIVKPVSQLLPGQKIEFPMQPYLNTDGSSRIEPAQGYSPGDYFWVDLNGHQIDEAKGQRPDCRPVPVRVANVNQEEIRNAEEVAELVGPGINNGQIVDIHDPGSVVETGNIYHVGFDFDSVDSFRDLMRDLQSGT